jgi:hypothetical protein
MGTAAEIWVDTDEQANSQAWPFRAFYRLLTVLALPKAAYLYLRFRPSPAGILWLRSAGHDPWKVVYAVAAARLIRHLHRATFGTPAPVVVWPKAMPSSCVIGFFHSRWDRVIAREVVRRQYCLIRTGPGWARRLGKQHTACSVAGLRSLVQRVGAGSRCAVAMDTFVDGGDNGFSGTRKGLNAAAVRLAAVTGTPLVPVWPIYERGVLRFDSGAPIAAATCAERQDQALRVAQQFFENAVRCDPGGWRRILSFLEWR